MDFPEWKFIKVKKDTLCRSYNHLGLMREVYFADFRFPNPLTRETAAEAIAEFENAIRLVYNNNGILFPIIDTQGLSLNFNVPISSLARIQSMVGPQILVGAGTLVKAIGNMISTLSSEKSILKFCNTIDDAIMMREKILNGEP